MELQSRLRELTEARKDKWRREEGVPPSVDPPRPAPEHPKTATVVAASADGSGVSPEPIDAPPEQAAPPQAAAAAPVDGPVDAAEVAVQAAEVAVQAAETGGERTFVRRRGLQAKAFNEALSGAIGRLRTAARDYGGTVHRQVAGRVRDLSGGLGAREQPSRPRPGDPVTAEELINDKSLSARLLGAGVFLAGVLVIGGVMLVQVGKLEVPWLEDSALPAAPSRTPVAAGGAAAAVGLGERESGTAEESGSGTDSSPDDSGSASSRDASQNDDAGSDQPAAGDAEPSAGDASIPAPTSSSAETLSPELLEFTRLQGDLAFRMGEYELARTDFEQGSVDCETLSERYARVDSAHLVLSRVVARARDLPSRQEEAYAELSALLDGVLRHYSASGCGLDRSELPR